MQMVCKLVDYLGEQLNRLLSLERYAKAPTFPEFVDFLLNTEVCNCTAINIKETHNSWPHHLE